MQDPNPGGNMHFSNLAVHIWQEADGNIGIGQGDLAAEFSENVTVLAVRRTPAGVRSWNSRRLSRCSRLRAAARPAEATAGRWAA
jgi:hypothetical protein